MNPKIVKTLKTILWIKLGFFAIFILLSKNFIAIGEKNIKAAPEETDNNALPSPSQVQNKTQTDLAAKAPTRQGFLEGLLDLPPLNVEASKKDEIGRYLSLVERAKQQVEDRLKVLKQRAKQLRKLEGTIDKKLKALDEERQFFASTIQQEKEIQSERLKTLVEFYGKMEPKKAAPVFESMDKDLVVALFKDMKKKQVTKILEGMSPEKSVAITEYFGRIGSAKEYDLLKEMNRSLQLAFNDCKGLPKE